MGRCAPAPLGKRCFLKSTAALRESQNPRPRPIERRCHPAGPDTALHNRQATATRPAHLHASITKIMPDGSETVDRSSRYRQAHNMALRPSQLCTENTQQGRKHKNCSRIARTQFHKAHREIHTRRRHSETSGYHEPASAASRNQPVRLAVL